MRLFITLTICLISAFQVLAVRISEETAFQKAQEFAKGRNINQSGSPKGLKKAKGNPTSNNYYVFNIGDEEGFVIISGNDRTECVLGYSDTGKFDVNNMPEGMHWLLGSYDSIINLLDTESENLSGESSWYAETRNDISPLVSTQWGQLDPYNAKCPTDDNKRCYTGCVATAMAQIMNFHKWPENSLPAMNGYYTNTNEIAVYGLIETQIDWTDMTDSSIATLMRYCGQSVKMNYTQYASSAYIHDAGKAFTDIFGYSKSALTIYRRNHSDNEWLDILYDNLQSGLPVLYGGNSELSGHAFIVDGYSDGRFHINWGWEGSCDGYFLLDILNPNGEDTYSKNAYAWKQHMIVNIYPPNAAETPANSKLIIHSISCDNAFLKKNPEDASFPYFKLTARVLAELDQDTEYYFGFALYNDKELISLLATEDDLIDFLTIDDLSIDLNIEIPSNIPVGNYRIYAVCRKSEKEDWQPLENSMSRYLDVKITESTLWLQPMPKDDNNTIKNIEFGIETIGGINYRLVYEYGNFRGYIEDSDNGKEYFGDINIPDYVKFLDMDFKVFGESDSHPFASCHGINSISTPIPLSISSNTGITSYVLREGALFSSDIEDCPGLERIMLPSTCSFYGTVNNCPKLMEIHLSNKYPVRIRLNQDGRLWPASNLPMLNDVYCYGDVPPVFLNDTNPIANASINIHIPIGTKAIYETSGWLDWNLIEDIEAPAEYIRWDYCGTDYDCSDGLVAVVGENNAEFAIRLPKQMIQSYIGCHIKAIEYYTPKELINDNRDCDVEYVFATDNEQDYIVKKNSSTIRGAWTRTELDEPIEITGEDLYIGIGRAGRLQINWANNEEYDDGLWHRSMGTDLAAANVGVWKRHAGMDDCPYPLAVRAIIEGDDLPIDAMIISAEYEDESEINNGKVKLRLRNRSNILINNIVFNVKIDGEETDPISVNTSLASNCTETIFLQLHGVKAAGDHIAEITISKINNIEDAIRENSCVSVPFSGLPIPSYPRKSVMETVIGTDLGSSPRGLAAMEYMKKKHEKNLIPIAVHINEMAIEDEEISYAPMIEEVGQIPTSIINRKESDSVVMVFNLNDNEETDLSIATEAKFGMDGGIDINTTSIFALDHENDEPYRIVNILVEDKVGPYMQANSFSTPSYPDNPSEIMNWWIHQNSSVEFVYDNVARGAFPFQGSKLGIRDEIVAEEEYPSFFNISLPSNIQSFENLKVVSMLTDSQSGEILNADVCEVTGPLPYSGDSNGNGEVNVADAVNVVNYVVGKQVLNFYKEAADVNKDKKLTVSDATGTITLLLNPTGDTDSSETLKKIRDLSNESEGSLIITEMSNCTDDIKSYEIYLSESSNDFIALQADVLIPLGFSCESIVAGQSVSETHRIHTRKLDDQRYRFVLFDLKGRKINSEELPIIRISVSTEDGNIGNQDIALENIIAVDVLANEFRLDAEDAKTSEVGLRESNRINIEVNQTSGCIEIRNAHNRKVEIYSPDGKSVLSLVCNSDFESVALQHGVYLIRIGIFTYKVMIL